MLKFLKNIAIYSVLILLAACNSSIVPAEKEELQNNSIKAPTPIPYEVVKVYPHDTSSYTQGLEWNGDILVEGTGNYGKSILHQLDRNMQPVGKKVQLKKDFFGEGITVFNHKIYQLTWKEHKVFVYNENTLVKENEFYWPYEGWGITHNDTALIVSTGGSNIYIVDANNFSIKSTIGVYNNYGYVSDINELELVDGKLFANIYGKKEIIVIDLSSGQITNQINFSNLLAQVGIAQDPASMDSGYVLNGIAFHAKSNTFYITGKCWPVMVQVKLK